MLLPKVTPQWQRSFNPVRIDRFILIATTLSLVFIFGIVAPATAQNTADEDQSPAQEYRISSIEYDITGLSRQFAIEAIVEDLYEGRVFTTEEQLAAFLADQQQILLNERTLAEAQVEYALSEVEPGVYDVDVTVRTRDSWNIIVLPYFRYSTDDGWLLSLRLRDYNFLGTQETLGVDFDRESDDGITDLSAGEIGISADLAWPFHRYGYDWRWLIGLDLELDLEDEESELEIVTGLDWSFPWLFGLDWTLGGRQSYTYFDPADPDGHLLQSAVQLSTRVNTPWTLPAFGTITYRPDWRVRQRYRFDGISIAAPLDRGERGPDARFRQRLSAGRVDWIGNFRRGREVSLGNIYEYNFYQAADKGAGEGWESIRLETEIEAHETVSAFGFSGRAGAFVDIADSEEFSDEVRGIRERWGGRDLLDGDYGFYTNLDAGVSVIRVRPIGEVILNFFLDTGRAGSREDGWDDMRYGGGFELFLFPLPTRAFYIRGSIGWDLEKVADDGQLRGDGRTDIFFGLDHHY